MPFSPKIKTDALVASARHCSVCHRYKGVKVEVHHIEQESEGGANTFDNAICLCFDCHCDAGHYNKKHPRGTKFSQKELIKAKEEWYEIVRNNHIESHFKEDVLLCQYYICKNYSDINSIANYDFSCFPFTDVFLYETEVFDTFKIISKNQKTDYRWATQGGTTFDNIDDYIKLYPDAKVIDKAEADFPYYDTIRTPSRKELIEKCAAQDGLVKYLIDANTPSEEIAYAANHLDACAGTDDHLISEEYTFRTIWCVFLTLKNTSDSPLTLKSINCSINRNGHISYKPMSSITTSNDVLNLPNVKILPNATVVIPITLILPPFEYYKTNVLSSWSLNGPSEMYTEISHCEIDTSINEVSNVIGPRIHPRSVNYEINNNTSAQEFHELDLNNIYIIDKRWGAGSCPHLFYIGKTIMYSREILAMCQNTIGNDSFIIPDNITQIVIAEIEDETTYIEYILLNNIKYFENTTLVKNQYLVIDVSEGMEIEISGYYIPERISVSGPSDAHLRNSLISKYMSEYKSIYQ